MNSLTELACFSGLLGAAVLAFMKALLDKNRARVAASAVAAAVIGLTWAVVGFGVEPLATWWVGGGVGMMALLAVGTYGLGCGVAWAVGRAKASRRAALACAGLGLPLGWLAFQDAMAACLEAVQHASPEDRQLILDASRAEAHSLLELPAVFAVLVVLVVLAASRGRGRALPPGTSGQGLGSAPEFSRTSAQ